MQTSWNGYSRNTPPRNSPSPSQSSKRSTLISTVASHKSQCPTPHVSPLIPTIHRFHCTIVRLRKKNHSTHLYITSHITHSTHTAHTPHTHRTHHKNGNTRKRKGQGQETLHKRIRSHRIGFGFFVLFYTGIASIPTRETEEIELKCGD
jgi:hypothetical protein